MWLVFGRNEAVPEDQWDVDAGTAGRRDGLHFVHLWYQGMTVGSLPGMNRTGVSG